MLLPTPGWYKWEPEMPMNIMVKLPISGDIDSGNFRNGQLWAILTVVATVIFTRHINIGRMVCTGIESFCMVLLNET